MSTKKKLIVAVVCLLVATCSLVTGTLAWLTDSTDTVTNTFAPSNISLTLVETDTDGDGSQILNAYQMIPGSTYAKDPKVTVTADIDCYVFVKITKSEKFETFMTWAIADGWTPLTGVDDVYYREVTAEKATDSEVFYVLKGEGDGEFKNGCVKIPGTITKADMSAFYNADGSRNDVAAPTLTVVAYACQKANVDTAAEAWALVKDLSNP